MKTRVQGGRTLLAGIVILTLAGCGLPQHKSLDDLSEPGASVTEADGVLGRFVTQRAEADRSLDAGALSDLEAGAVRDIDEGGYTIRRGLGISLRPLVVDQPATVWTSSFNSYPLWFVALARLPKDEQQVAYVFRRTSTTSPWRLVAAPRLADSTTVPTLSRDAAGTRARYVGGGDAHWSDGGEVKLDRTPQQIADAYADVLTSKGSEHADEFVLDSFITQMREIRRAQPDEGVRFEQRWEAEPVDFVLRLADGGALMFVDLARVDAFDVQAGNALKFSGSEAGVFLPDPIRKQAKLRYQHEVLVVVPGAGKPLVIGQYGGLVSATGH